MNASWHVFRGDGPAGLQGDGVITGQQMVEEGDRGALCEGFSARDADMAPSESADLVEDGGERPLFAPLPAEIAIAPLAPKRTACKPNEGRHRSGEACLSLDAFIDFRDGERLFSHTIPQVRRRAYHTGLQI